MTTVTRTPATTTAAATQAASNANASTQGTATYTNADLVGQGTSQGIQVAELEANNPNFDVTQYASAITPYLQSKGLSSDQINTYLSAMVSEFNYLTPTSQLDTQNSQVGSSIINQVLPNASEPGTSENPATTSTQTLANQGTVLGQQLAAAQANNSTNFDIASYTQNLVNEMTKAGYNSNQTWAFSSAVMMGYASALGGYLSN